MTTNYDLLAEIGDVVPTSIARACWRAGLLPNYLTSPPVLQGTPFADLEVFTLAPELDVVADPHTGGFQGLLKQPMLIRHPTIQREIANTLEVRAPIALVDRIVDGIRVQFLEFDLGGVDIDNTAFTNGQNAMVEAALAWLGALGGTQSIPITPALRPDFRIFPVIAEAPASVKLYANIDGRDGGPTIPRAELLFRHPIFDKPPFPNLAAAVDGGLFLSQVRAKLVEKGVIDGQIIIDKIDRTLLDLSVGGTVAIDIGTGIDFPFLKDGVFKLPLKFDFSPTLQRIKLTDDVSIELGDGHVNVGGSIKAIIDNGPDVDVDFDVRIVFRFEDGQLVPVVTRADIDIDTTILQILMVVLFGPLGLLIGKILDDVIDEAASGAANGQSFPVDIPTQTMFLGSIAVTNASNTTPAPVTLRVLPHKPIVRPNLIGAKLMLEAVAHGTPPEPTYCIGNISSREVHRSNCEFVALMSDTNKVSFVRPGEAVAEGYDGCRLCLPEFDGSGAAFLFVRFRRPAGFRQTRTKAITVSGQRLTNEPTNLTTSFSATGRLGASDPDGYWFDSIQAKDLAHGLWSVTLVDGDWTATKSIQLKGGDDKVSELVFRYGVDAPPVGPPIGGMRLTYRCTAEQAAVDYISTLYIGEFQGPSDGTVATARWSTNAGGPIVSGLTIVHRDAPFLHPGKWLVTVEERNVVQTRMVEVEPNEMTKVVFNRP
jgi:hypothetical protein